ncbi:hypothetical protein EVAR_26900_1 [Eumeta japonica]|uniref:Uncharacterized protein n=1 Tax=Eumeta variegata TaxID=151549 RepID=A0A4C1VRQ4_EUMVA|nr:hypothetical protein EVAR_26900_1 [Eumeta japonica]
MLISLTHYSGRGSAFDSESDRDLSGFPFSSRSQSWFHSQLRSRFPPRLNFNHAIDSYVSLTLDFDVEPVRDSYPFRPRLSIQLRITLAISIPLTVTISIWMKP